MSNYQLRLAVAVLGSTIAVYAQQQTSVTIDGKAVSVKYSSPTAKNRLAANFHTDSDLAFKGLNVPKGDYTIYILAEGSQWQLALNKAKGQKPPTYDAKSDLGRVLMTMGKGVGPGDACKIVLTKTAALAGRLEVTWNAAVASAPFHLDRGASDSEW